jgi:hypothetical protein
MRWADGELCTAPSLSADRISSSAFAAIFTKLGTFTVSMAERCLTILLMPGFSADPREAPSGPRLTRGRWWRAPAADAKLVRRDGLHEEFCSGSCDCIAAGCCNNLAAVSMSSAQHVLWSLLGRFFAHVTAASCCLVIAEYATSYSVPQKF